VGRTGTRPTSRTVEKCPYPKGHHGLLRCASSFVIATYNLKVTRVNIRLTPLGSGALHLDLFEQSWKTSGLFLVVIAGLDLAIQVNFSKILVEIQLIIAYS